MSNQKSLHEFANIFRCSLEMAPIYIARIHERMGHEIPMDTIIAAMKKIAPKKLSMDTIVDRLQKMERAPARTRAAKPALEEDAGTEEDEADPPAPAKLRASSHKNDALAGHRPTTLGQIGKILAANWERGRKHGLKPPVLSADKFVKTAQTIAGTPKPTVIRVLQAIIKLDKRDVLLTPNLVADEINETDKT